MARSTPEQLPSKTVNVRNQILEAAYFLFSTQGTARTGISAIIAHANVARMSLYQHYHSKNDLVRAFLDLREQRSTIEWLQNEVRQRATSPHTRRLAMFGVFDEWFQKGSFEGCSFINVLLEAPADGDVRQAAACQPPQHPFLCSRIGRGGQGFRSQILRTGLAHADEGFDRGCSRRQSELRTPGKECWRDSIEQLARAAGGESFTMP